MGSKMGGVVFVANKAPDYRIPFFNLLAEKLNVKFVFTHEEGRVKGLEASHQVLKGLGFKKYRVHLGLLRVLYSENPSKVVFLPLDPLHLVDNFLLFLFCKIKGVDYYVWCERWWYKSVPLKDRVSLFFYKIIIRNAAGFFVAGKKSYRFIKSFGVSDKKIFFARNASEIFFDEKKVQNYKAELVERFGLKGKRVVLYVGRLIKRKGVQYLIRAFSRIKGDDLVLVIVGGGDFYNLGERSIGEHLKSVVKEVGVEDRVVFVGHVRRELLPSFFLLADVLVVPSITYKIGDAWGLVVNEAMQFGVPVIATDAVGASYDLIKNGVTGFVVKERSSEALKRAINKVVRNPVLRSRMSEKSREIIKNRFNYKIMVEGFLKGLR